MQELEAETARLQAENQALAGRISRAVCGFVRIEDIDPTIVIDLRYATADNFTGRQIYPGRWPSCSRDGGQIGSCQCRVSEMGYTLKVWDAYRPAWAERELWHATDQKAYVADPRYPSRHNRGPRWMSPWWTGRAMNRRCPRSLTNPARGRHAIIWA